jgi:hypothetical protein
LWREAVRDMFATIEEHVNAPGLYDEDLDPVERFRQQMRRYTRYCAQHPEHARITIAETIRGGPRLEWMIEAFVKQNHAGFTPQLEALMESVPCPGCSRNRCITPSSAWPSCPSFWPEARIIFGYDFTDDAAIERHADAILALLLRQSEAG